MTPAGPEKEFRDGRGQALIERIEARAVSDLDTLAARSVRDCWERQLWTLIPHEGLLVHKTAQLRTAYYSSVPPGDNVPIRDLDSALDGAAAYGRCGDPGAPLYLLVTALEYLTGSRVADSWFELDAGQLAGLRTQAPERFGQGTPRLVIDVRPERPALGPAAVPTWPACVVAHYWTAEQGWARDDEGCGPTLVGVQRAVDTLINRMYVRGSARFSVGFILPRAALATLPETWTVDQEFEGPVPIDQSHPVVLHSGERFSSRQRVGAVWRDRLRAVRQRLDQTVPDVAWLEPGDRADPERLRDAVRRAKETCVGLGFTLDSAPPNLRTDPIMATVFEGAPFVLWADAEPGDWPQVRNLVAQLVANGVFDELPQRLHEQRARLDATAGVRLRLLWDDEALLPPIVALRGEGTLALESRGGVAGG